jgi:hypothetical protein
MFIYIYIIFIYNIPIFIRYQVMNQMLCFQVTVEMEVEARWMALACPATCSQTTTTSTS